MQLCNCLCNYFTIVAAIQFILGDLLYQLLQLQLVNIFLKVFIDIYYYYLCVNYLILN